MITGREIQVIESARGETPLRVVCPTKHCDAMPMEWVLPTEDVLIKIAMVEVEGGWLRLVRRPAGPSNLAIEEGTVIPSAEPDLNRGPDSVPPARLEF